MIVTENLQIKNMEKNHKLAKAITDASWYELTRQLEYKAKWNGREYIKVDTFYGTARINACGDSRLRGLRSRKPIGFRQWVVHNGDLWLTQKAMSELYNCSSDNIGLHLKNIYNDLELDQNSTTEDFSVVQKEGIREVTRKLKYYNLDAVISVGYRVNSDRAIQFRRWATNILKEFSKKGYIIDKKRMANGAFFDEDYYDSLLAIKR